MIGKKLILYTVLLFSSFCFSQKNKEWEGYFSYNNVRDVTVSNTSLLAGCENTVFSKNTISEEIKTINSIDGFKPDDITNVYFSKQKSILFVGNKNGLLLLVLSDGRILQKRGILDEIPVNPTIKGINHFYEYQTKMYISCDFGIASFDLNSLEFSDTFVIGNNGSYEKVFQTTVFNDEIYAVTQNNGIKKALVSNPNLIDFNQWQVFHPGFWNGIVTFQNQLIASNYSILSKYQNNQFIPILIQSQTILKLKTSDNNLTATTQNSTYVFNESLTQIANVQSNQINDFSGQFTSSITLNNTLFIGTNTNGVIEVPLTNLTNVTFTKPNGPEQNYIFRLKSNAKTLWALYGKYNRTYNPYFPPFGLGYFPLSKFTKENGWTQIPYNDLLGAKSLSNIVYNPTNENEFYVSSYYSGLLKFQNEIPTTIFNASNTGSNGLQSIVGQVPNDVRVNGPVFDSNGNIWMTNSIVEKPLVVFKTNGQWQAYDFDDVIPNDNSESYGILTIDKNNTKWIPSINNGLIAFNETLNNKSIVIKTGAGGNLPNNDVRVVAIDTRNQVWLGTAKGLRIIQSVDLFLSQDEIQSKPIIILENDLAQELFFEQFIIDIAVDGANRKWVSIADSGVYLVSSDGQETIQRFTKENSPLPSNNVNDIEIDAITGEVFFGTDKGLVSFKGSATSASEDLNNVYVYPNPVRPDYSGTVKISGLLDKANVKITDVTGSLVFETTSLGGTIEWDTTAFGKYKVASGVYMVFISAEDGIETKVKKVMIIR